MPVTVIVGVDEAVTPEVEEPFEIARMIATATPAAATTISAATALTNTVTFDEPLLFRGRAGLGGTGIGVSTPCGGAGVCDAPRVWATRACPQLPQYALVVVTALPQPVQ